MSDELNFDPNGPAPSGMYWVERLKGNDSQKFVVYSPQGWGVWTHYHGPRIGTKACYADKSRCFSGHKEDNMRWYWYLFAHSLKLNRPCFVQLTQAVRGQLLSQIDHGVSFRGMTITVYRTKADNGRLNARIDQYASKQATDRMRKDENPMKSLLHLWKEDREGLPENVDLDGEKPAPELRITA